MKNLLLKLFLLFIFLTLYTYWGAAQPTDCVPINGDNATISFGQGIVPTFNGAPLPNGSYISAMFNSTSGQKCAGFTTWQNSATSIAVSGASGTVEGYASGETYKFRIQLPNGTIIQNSNITVMYQPNGIICDNGGTYKKDGLSCIQSFAAVMTSSSEDLVKERGLMLFPNPTSGLIKILTENDQIDKLELFSLDAKSIQIIQSSKDNTIDLSHLNPGSYILKGVTNNHLFAKKVVIVR